MLGVGGHAILKTTSFLSLGDHRKAKYQLIWRDGCALHRAEAGKEHAPSAFISAYKALNIFTNGLICRPWCNDAFEPAMSQVMLCL